MPNYGISIFNIESSPDDNVHTWLAISTGAGAMAIDKMFEFHEQTVYLFGEGDYLNIVMMLVAITGLVMLYHTEKPSRQVNELFAVGFFFYVCYLAVDFGDGDFFQLPERP